MKLHSFRALIITLLTLMLSAASMLLPMGHSLADVKIQKNGLDFNIIIVNTISKADAAPIPEN